MTDWIAQLQAEAAIIDSATDRLIAAITNVSDVPPRVDGPRLWNWSQRDPIWRNEIFAGYLKFETDGCYVCGVADIVTLAGYEDNPVEVARKLRNAGCFDGALLRYPERIPRAYPLLEYNGTHRWYNDSANMDVVWSELEQGPTICEVDFRWSTQLLNQHFVVLIEPTADRGDVWINDPWDGSVVRLLQKYAGESWDLERAIYGLRCLRVAGSG